MTRETSILAALLALTASAATISSDRSGVTMAKSGRDITKADARCFAASCLGINERLCYINDFNANGGADWTAGTNALVLNARASCINGSGMYDPSFAPFLYPVHGGDPTRLVPLAMRDAFRSDVKNFFSSTTYPTGNDWVWLGISDDSTLSISANGITIHTLGGRALGDLFDAYHWEDYRWFTAQSYLDTVYTNIYGLANAPDMAWTNTTITVMATNGWACTYPEMLTNYTTRCLHEDWRWACVNAFAPFQNIWLRYTESPVKYSRRKWYVQNTARCNISATKDSSTKALTVTVAPQSQAATTNTTTTSHSLMSEDGVEVTNTTLFDNGSGTLSEDRPWRVWYYVGNDGDYTVPRNTLYPTASGSLMALVDGEPWLRGEDDAQLLANSATCGMSWTSYNIETTTQVPSGASPFNCDVEANMKVYRAMKCTGHADGAATSTVTAENFSSPFDRTVAADGGWCNGPFQSSDILNPFATQLNNLREAHDYGPMYDMASITMPECKVKHVMAAYYYVSYYETQVTTNFGGFAALINPQDPLSQTNETMVATFQHISDVISGVSSGWLSIAYATAIDKPTRKTDGNDYRTRSTEYKFWTYYFGAFYGWAKNVKWSNN